GFFWGMASGRAARAERLRAGGRIPRRLSPLVKLKTRRLPSRDAGFWNCTAARGSLAPTRPDWNLWKRRTSTRLTPPLFACRPPMRGDGGSMARHAGAGDKGDWRWRRGALAKQRSVSAEPSGQARG